MLREEEGSWQSILNSLSTKASKDGTLDYLKGCDAYENRIAKVRHSIGIRNKVASWISLCAENRYPKCGSVAAKLREEGNNKFSRKENASRCLKLYSESVIMAGEYGPELGLAYGNRSAALYHLSYYEAALQDISLALRHQYPANLRYKLYQRHGSCLSRLNDFPGAIESFDKALESLNDANKLSQDKRDALAKDIRALRVEIVNIKESQLNTPPPSPPREPSQGFNPQLKGSSSKLILQSIMGERRVLTEGNVELGETLFIESPFSMVLLPNSYSTHCHHCTRAFVAPIPCLKCTQARFCREECRTDAWESYHQYECTGLDLAHSVGIAHLALRTILIAGYPLLSSLKEDIGNATKSRRLIDEEVIERVEEDESKVDNLTEKRQNYVRVFNLKDHIDDLSGEDIFQYTVTAFLLTTYLQKRTKFFQQCPSLTSSESSFENLSLNENEHPDAFLYTAGLMLKHICQLVCNGSAIYEVLPESSQDCDLDMSNNNSAVYTTSQQRIATAIYPSVSMMNHSCKPNVINSFHEGKIIVRAIRPIIAMSEVLNCYGPHFRRHSLAERRELLKYQYHFYCSCEVCSEESQYDFQDRFTALKCNFCEGPVFDSSQNDESPSSAPGVCGDCGREQENSDCVMRVIMAYDLYKSGIEALDQGLVRDALPLLQSCYQMRVDALYAHHKEVTEVANQLAKAYCTIGSFGESARYLQICLPAIQERFGAHSLEYAHELLNYADVMICDFQDGTKRISRLGEKIEEAKNCLHAAATIFDLHYGKWNKTYLETVAKIKKLEIAEGPCSED